VVSEVAIAMPLEPGGPGVDALFRCRWPVATRLGLGGLLAIPVLSSTVRSGPNSASVSAFLLGAELTTVVVDTRALRVLTTAGFAAALLRTQGVATAPYTAQSDSALVGVPLTGVELAPLISDRFRLCLGGLAGLALPKAEIAFAGKQVGTWGRPLGLLSVAVSADY
jgi:hypothetical protein